jgi:hypothetical protein
MWRKTARRMVRRRSLQPTTKRRSKPGKRSMKCKLRNRKWNRKKKFQIKLRKWKSSMKRNKNNNLQRWNMSHRLNKKLNKSLVSLKPPHYNPNNIKNKNNQNRMFLLSNLLLKRLMLYLKLSMKMASSTIKTNETSIHPYQ